MGDVGFLTASYFPGKRWGTSLGLGSSTTGFDLSSFRADWDKWNLLDLVRSSVMVVLYVMAWFARILLVFLPQGIPFYSLSSGLESALSSHYPPCAPVESETDHVNASTSGAIGRALVQILALVNDLPASSGKYSFARGLAEKIVQENIAHGHGYESVNRAALSAGFNRTLVKLNQSLESIHQQRNSSGDLWSLPMKVLGMLPIIPRGGLKFVLPSPLSLLKTHVNHFIPTFSKTDKAATITSNSGDIFSGPGLSSSFVGKTEMAEKLAQELLWMAEMLAETSALEEAIAQWSSSSSLASISLASSPRVQRALVRLSALFAKELVTGDTRVARDGRFKILFLWLPLLCTATHGGDGPIFTISERMDVEHTLEKAIHALHDSDQEVILAIWLQEFALSSSDWPNLQPCYDRWCKTTRRLSNHGRLSETS